jgi:MazG family protein
MSESITSREFEASDGVADWRVLGRGACACFRTGSFAAGVELVEAIGALGRDDDADEHLAEELGDVLLQVVLHAAIAAQQGRFTIADVVAAITAKMVRRHPHVFGEVTVDSAADVALNWEAIKAAERAASGAGDHASVLDGVSGSLPALAYADALFRKAAKVGFDWPDVHGALPKIAEEADEVAEALESGDRRRIDDELGDLLFAVVNVARHADVEPEAALRAATQKFRRRFEAVERLAAERGVRLADADLAALDALWDEIKRDARP